MSEKEINQNILKEADEKPYISNEDNYFDRLEKEFEYIKWKKINGLYSLKITFNEFDGYKDVEVILIGGDHNNTPFDIYKYISDASERHGYHIMYIEEFFTLEEIQQIIEGFSKINNAIIHGPFQAEIPIDPDAAILPFTRGGPDLFLFHESENYPLDFKIEGYYDLSKHKKLTK